jgi:TolB-like protein/class 3 adenylate cyclase
MEVGALAREQRKLAAILAADVVGYSRLMGRDESGTLARLKAHRTERLEPALARSGGRLVKLTGDGALVEFGSAVDALSAAIEFQQAMAGINRDEPEDAAIVFRIGLHLGDLIVDGDDLYGDGVNVAARLEGECPPGGIVISRTVHEAVEGRLKVTFEDLGSLALKNIERPIHAFRVRWEPADWHASDVSASHHAAIATSALADVPLTLPDKPSIAVLPFQNMSGDPEQEYFADGIVEDIITALSRFNSLFVIARNSSFTYKGKAVDIKQVGRELGVRYVLEGSVRKAGGRIRITGQLIEATSGTHIWADRFDGELRDVFDLQDSVTASVIGAIAPKLEQSEIERIRAKPTERLDSYDCFLRGKAALSSRAKWETSEARNWFTRACELDPGYAAAQIMRANSIMIKQTTTGVLLRAKERTEVLAIAEHACLLAGPDPFVLAIAAHLFGYVGHAYDRAEAMIEQAVSLNPNDSMAWGRRGWISLMCVEPARAIESFERQVRFSPLDPQRVSSWNGIAFALFHLRDYDQGRAVALKALELNVDAHTLCALITNEVGAGRREEARGAANRLLKLRPHFRASHSRRLFPTRSVEECERVFAALRDSGIPE